MTFYYVPSLWYECLLTVFLCFNFNKAFVTISSYKSMTSNVFRKFFFSPKYLSHHPYSSYIISSHITFSLVFLFSFLCYVVKSLNRKDLFTNAKDFGFYMQTICKFNLINNEVLYYVTQINLLLALRNPQ